MIDTVFKQAIKKQFEFDEEVASVFDDMLSRSVPYYKEMQGLTIDFALKFLQEDDKVYDLGCSTASTLIELSKCSNINLDLVGIDNSESMLSIAKKKSNAFGVDIDFIESDILDVPLFNAQLVISNYTLQFIRPIKREYLINKIFKSLNDRGIFIFSEKVVSSSNLLSKYFIDEYYKFKKDQGYSEFEISQKREALENILIPYSEEENKKIILDAGFSHCEILFKWLNFSTFIAIK